MKSSGIQWLDRLRMQLRTLTGRRALNQELQAELAFHREGLIARYRAQGLTPAEAARRARLELGGPDQIREEVGDVRPWRWLDRLRADTVLAFRTFRKFPGFTITAMVTIAIGMGANTTLFTVMHAGLSRPLPVVDPGGIRNVYLTTEKGRGRAIYGTMGFVSLSEFRELATATTAELAAVAELDLTWRAAATRSVHAQLVSSNLLTLIGARPTLGRFFAADESVTPGSAPVVVLSHRFWRRELGRDSAIVGKRLTLNRQPFTVIGVTDSLTEGPLMQRAQLWIPLTMQRVALPTEPFLETPGIAWLQAFARNRAGVSDGAVAAELAVLGSRAVAAHDSAAVTTTTVVPGAFLNFPRVQQQALPAVLLLWIAFLSILIVACANVANLLMARGFSRQREIAIRLALGAGRRRVVAQLLTESAWLGLLGGGLGLLVSAAATTLAPLVLPADLDVQLGFAPDRSILLFTGLAALGSGLAFGLLPAIQVTRVDLTPGLKTEGRALAGAPRARLQQWLVGIQVAVSLVLLVNAGLVIRSFTKVLAAGVGKPLDHLLIASFDLRQQQYDGDKSAEFFRRMRERVEGTPGVVAVGATLLDPELSQAESVVQIGDSADATAVRFDAAFDEIEAGTLPAVGVRLLAGRNLTREETTTGATVIVVDERLADRLGGSPVGKRVWITTMGPNSRSVKRPHEIVGVVASTTPLTFWSRLEPTYYVPMPKASYLDARLLVRFTGSGTDLPQAIRRAGRETDPEVSVRVKPIEENVASALLPARILSASLSTLGALALILTAVGLFGTIGFAVAQRLREIGIRAAIGATPKQIVGLVCRQGARPVVLGLVGGLGVTVVGGLAARSVWHGLSPFDPVPIGLAVGLLTVAATVAFLVPARRAARVRPASVLRVD